jgi:AcrR family transcriptional regulator
MGLREKKIARTREQIVDSAIDLFIEHGFDDTTMEQIAERAEVGTSTLYRYFPSKDLLLLERMTHAFDFGDRLRARPLEEPLNEALGAVIRGALVSTALHDERFADVRRILDSTSGPHARLWDLVAASTSDLEHAIAERTGREHTDLGVRLTARMVLAVHDIAGETWWGTGHPEAPEQFVDVVLEALPTIDVTLPIRSRSAGTV